MNIYVSISGGKFSGTFCSVRNADMYPRIHVETHKNLILLNPLGAVLKIKTSLGHIFLQFLNTAKINAKL